MIIEQKSLTVALDKPQAGHGGKMLERFTALTRIDAQNWQDKVREQQGPRIEEQPELLRI